MIPYIHIEGMDLSGKSTTSRILAKKNGFELRTNALSDRNNIYGFADRLRKEGEIDDRSLGYIYVAALREDILNLQPITRPRVQDSTVLLRSLAYHAVKGNQGIVHALLEEAEHHPRFTHSFVLTASLEDRVQRLESRRQNNPEEVCDDDLLVVRNPYKFQQMEDELIAYSTTQFNSKLVDTTGRSIPEIIQQLEEEIDENNHTTQDLPRI